MKESGNLTIVYCLIWSTLILLQKLQLTKKLKYAIPVYSLKFIERTIIDENLKFIGDDNIYVERLYLRIRGESVKFGSGLRKK